MLTALAGRYQEGTVASPWALLMLTQMLMKHWPVRCQTGAGAVSCLFLFRCYLYYCCVGGCCSWHPQLLLQGVC
jgi:hypothetical protein